MWLVYLAFFLSGFPALIYQLLWQRALFTIYGVNIESITVVVAAFMAGLGLGSLLGGAISTLRWIEPLVAFAVFELSIGAFGLLSPWLFDVVGARTLGASTVQTFFITFALVLFPTFQMGATLPLLVSHLVRRFRNVGASVGVLYFANTLGGAVVCFVAVVWMFGSLGRSGSLTIAAGINLLVGTAALLAYWRSRGTEPAGSSGWRDGGSPGPGPGGARAGSAFMGFPMALFAVAMTGYISLSYEILWVRTYSFLLGGAAAAFPLLLGAFLAGVALGSWAAGHYCRNIVGFNASTHRRALAYFVMLAGASAFLVVPGIAAVNTWSSLGFVFSLFFVTLGAALLGAMLPLISHITLGANQRVGVGLSYLYLANIAGAATGTLITGFILMDHWSARGIGVFTALLGLSLSLALLLGGPSSGRRRWLDVGGVALVAVAVLLTSGPLFDQLYERLLYKVAFTAEKRFARILENRSGVIAVSRDGTVFGGGLYDGHYNTDVVNDMNLIVRPYFLGALHPAPKRVLMIGLASGSWAQVAANYPGLEKLTIVEINPGYTELIPEHGPVASLLRNPKVELFVDDGRRWLNRNPEARFDAIISNTSFVWRAHATNLLSAEFLQLIREHLSEGGIAFYNTGNDPHVQATAVAVFPYVLRVYNHVAVSDSPIRVDRRRWEGLLDAFRIDGVPVLPPTPDERSRRRIARLLARADDVGEPGRDEDPSECCFLETRESIVRRTAGREAVSEDNMITEWPRILTGEIGLRRILERMRGRAVGL